MFATVLGYLVDVVCRRADHNVLRLDVRVNDVAGLMEEFQPLQHLHKNRLRSVDYVIGKWKSDFRRLLLPRARNAYLRILHAFYSRQLYNRVVLLFTNPVNRTKNLPYRGQKNGVWHLTFVLGVHREGTNWITRQKNILNIVNFKIFI